MREKLRYALIGCGRIAPNHIAAYLNNAEDLELCAVCAPVSERMEAVLRPLPEQDRARVRRYTDHRELLAKEAPQLCAVATESGLHAQVGLDVLRAGSNVIIEKPLALSLADARALIAEADARGLKLCACHQNRFNKSIQKIRSAVEEKRFGRMLHGTVHVRWNRGEEYYRQAPWRGTWAMDGGALMNQCIHSIDLLRWMLGDGVTEVMAYTDNLNHPYIQAEDLGLALVRFESGAYGVVEGTTNVYPKNLEETLYLFGEQGTVKIGGTSTNNIDVWQFADQREEDAALQGLQEATSNVYGNGHTAVYADMMDAIVHDRAPYIDAQAGRRALEMILAMYQSAATGMPVKLPLKDVASLDFTGRFDKKEETNG